MKNLTARYWTIVGAALAAIAQSGCDQGDRGSTEVRQGAATIGLQPGDLAITCFASDNDSLQIMPLVAIEDATDVKYTDREATTAGVFNTGENVNVALTVNGAKAAGQPFGMPLTGIGDPDESIFIYQGTIPVTGGSVSGGSL